MILGLPCAFMKFILLLSCLITSVLASAQNDVVTQYDSSYNFSAEQYAALKGQTLSFLPYSSNLPIPPQYLNSFFPAKPLRLRSSSGKPANFDPVVFVNELIGKQFTIIDFKDSVAGGKPFGFFVKLAATDSSANVFYYRIADNRERLLKGEYNTPFIITGYFEKQKAKFINKNYYLCGLLNNIRDINTGGYLRLHNENEKWECYDVTLLQDSAMPFALPSLLLKNRWGHCIAAYFLNANDALFDNTRAVYYYSHFITEERHAAKISEQAAKAKAAEEERAALETSKRTAHKGADKRNRRQTALSVEQE